MSLQYLLIQGELKHWNGDITGIRNAPPQLNFAMYYGQQSMLPLYYCVYPGSVPDKTHLDIYLRDNELFGCKGTKYVLDRGFFTADIFVS
jgi:transposase